MGNKKSRIRFNPNEQLQEDSTFLVQGNFGSKQLKLREDMIIENLDSKTPQSEKDLGYIFYNEFKDTFVYLGYNGKVRSNILENQCLIEDYKRSFYLKKQNFNYDDLQYKNIKSKISSLGETDSPYDIYIINLKHRTDRKNEILEKFSKSKVFNLKFFEAIKHKHGWMGCGLSHLYLIQYALTNGKPYIIVAEDDFELKVSEEEAKKILDQCIENIDSWDIFNGSPIFWDKRDSMKDVKFYKGINDDFIKVNWGQSTTFMIYNIKSYKKMLNYPFRNQIDQYISENFIQLAYKKENFCGQRNSYSDVQNNNRNELEGYFNTQFEILKKSTSESVEPVIGIYSIFIDQYQYFYKNFISNIESFFLPQYKKYYYIVTDNENLEKYNDRTFIYYTKKIGWPYETLYRFKYFLNFNNFDVLKCNYFYFLNSNTLSVKRHNLEILPNINNHVFTLHNAFKNKSYEKLTYEKNKASTACINKEHGKKFLYVGGRFYGAEVNSFVNLCRILDEKITIDEKNGIIAEWHDESHLNFYTHYVLGNNFKILDTDYHVPQEIAKKFKNISMVYLDKNRYLPKNGAVKDYAHSSKNTRGKIKFNKYNQNIIGDIRKIKGFVFKCKNQNETFSNLISGIINCLVLKNLFNTKLYFDINSNFTEYFNYENSNHCDIEINTIDFLTNIESNNNLDNFLENIFNNNTYKDKIIGINCNISFYEKFKKYNDLKDLYENSYKEIFTIFKPKDYIFPKLDNSIDNLLYINFEKDFLHEEIEILLKKAYEDFGKCKIMTNNTDLLSQFDIILQNKFVIENNNEIPNIDNINEKNIVSYLQKILSYKNYKNVIVNQHCKLLYDLSLYLNLNYHDYKSKILDFKNISLVISRFRESSLEVNNIIKKFKKYNPQIFIYNKGESDLIIEETKNINILNIPNVGREGQTWIHHMIENYDTLTDIIYFIPASAENKSHLNSYKNVFNALENSRLISNSESKIDYNFTLDKWNGTHKQNSEIVRTQNFVVCKIRPYGLWFEENISKPLGKKYMDWSNNGCGGIIQATKFQIRKIPRELIQKWNTEISEGPNPEVGHYWERSWASIFI